MKVLFNILRRPVPCLLACAAFFGMALQNAMEHRHRARQLTGELDALRQESRVLKDEKRSLFLEHMTVTEYEQLRAAAAGLGMREPEIGDGTLVFFTEETP